MNDLRKVLTITGLMMGGAVIGAGLGLLLAPQPGWITRQRLRSCAARAQTEATEFAQHMQACADSAVEGVSARLNREESENTAHVG